MLTLKAVKNWRKKLKAALKAQSLEGYCQQVKRCMEIALKCIESDRHKRPKIGEIVRMLEETETLIHDRGALLDVHPMELRFPFRPKKYISCFLQLYNKKDDRVAFRLHCNSPKGYLTKLPVCGVVPPSCVYTLALTTSRQPQHPLPDSDVGLVLHSVAVTDHQEHQLKDLDQTSAVREYDNLFEKAKEMPGDEVQEVTLKSVCAPLTEDASSTVSLAKIK